MHEETTGEKEEHRRATTKGIGHLGAGFAPGRVRHPALSNTGEARGGDAGRRLFGLGAARVALGRQSFSLTVSEEVFF